MAVKINQYVGQIAIHPGLTLSEKLEELGMGPKAFAVRTGKPEKTIIAVLKGKSSITPEMAVQFEYVLNIPAHFWMNLQRNYDELLAREESRQKLADSLDWANLFPLTAMEECGWIAAADHLEGKTAALLSFFGVSNHKAWAAYYMHQQLKVAFRISLAETASPYAISAWLRQGERQAEAIPSGPFQEKAFQRVLPEIKCLMTRQEGDFDKTLQRICLSAGVKVVFTPGIEQMPVQGCTRWLNDKPLIQLTDRFRRNDLFWFTFFHEAGHILLHGKKDIFLEPGVYPSQDKAKERAADQFATRWTLGPGAEHVILQVNCWTIEIVTQMAAELETHPAMIVGYLQREGRVDAAFGRQFFSPIFIEAEEGGRVC
jgi:HTH-type transcriptional regulator / antitoxin HigA